MDSLEEGDKKEAVADKADSEHQENAITKMNFDKTFAQPGFDAVEEFEVTWKNQIISAENIGYLKPSKNNIIEEFQVISEFKEELNQDAKTPVDDFVQVADNNKDSSQTVVSIDQVRSLRALNNFGITLDNSGEIKVIALNEFGLSPLSDNFINASLTTFPEGLQSTDLPVLGAVSEVDDLYEIGQQNSSNKSSVSKSENATAVLGHKIEDTGQALGLTDAVDVVFYEGGDATISGFELVPTYYGSFYPRRSSQKLRTR